MDASLLQLLCFVRVVEAGSFAGAGRRLGIIPSAPAPYAFVPGHGMQLRHRARLPPASSPLQDTDYLAGGCGPVLHADLRENLLQVLVDGAWAQVQDLSDVAVGLAKADP